MPTPWSNTYVHQKCNAMPAILNHAACQKSMCRQWGSHAIMPSCPLTECSRIKTLTQTFLQGGSLLKESFDTNSTCGFFAGFVAIAFRGTIGSCLSQWHTAVNSWGEVQTLGVLSRHFDIILWNPLIKGPPQEGSPVSGVLTCLS